MFHHQRTTLENKAEPESIEKTIKPFAQFGMTVFSETDNVQKMTA